MPKFYVVNEETGARLFAQFKGDAMALARAMRADGCRRCMVCAMTGRIVAAWDDASRSI